MIASVIVTQFFS